MAKKLTAAQIAAQQRFLEDAETEHAFNTGVTTLRDLISPSSYEIKSSYFQLGTKFGRAGVGLIATTLTAKLSPT